MYTGLLICMYRIVGYFREIEFFAKLSRQEPLARINSPISKWVGHSGCALFTSQTRKFKVKIWNLDTTKITVLWRCLHSAYTKDTKKSFLILFRASWARCCLVFSHSRGVSAMPTGLPTSGHCTVLQTKPPLWLVMIDEYKRILLVGSSIAVYWLCSCELDQ